MGQFQSIGPKKFQIPTGVKRVINMTSMTTTGDLMVKSVFNIATTGAIWAPKRVNSGRKSSELVFHLHFGGVAVVVRPSGENFPSPFNQFQSIGQKKFQIPIPRATYVHNL